VIQSASDSIC